MDKRYQVFVSSTYKDLLEARQEVMQALLELDCIPAGMELFPAADDDQWTLIKQVIDDCDYYIVVIGGRYGTIGPEGKSFTQLEYEYALSKDLPVIAFLYKEPQNLPAKNTEQDPEKNKKLLEFRLLTERKMVRYWSSPADLGSAVSRSLIKLIKSKPATGWVKADLLPSKDTTEELLQLRKEVEALQRELEASKNEAPKETEHLSQGEDLFRVHFRFKGYSENSFLIGEVFSDSFEWSWNQLFARVSPLMIDEATDNQLQKELNEMIQNERSWYLEHEDYYSKHRLQEYEITDSDFNTIKVQFIALKLIKKSIKSRSVKDTRNYWALTSYGETVMMSLRAIRRGDFGNGGTNEQVNARQDNLE